MQQNLESPTLDQQHAPPRIRTVEQLRTLKAMRVLDRFTTKKLAAIAGIPAATVRSLLCRWEKEKFCPLIEDGVERSLSAGQPSKVYVLADGMAAVIDAMMGDADHRVVDNRVIEHYAADRSVAGDSMAVAERAEHVPPLRRMNLLDAAMEMVSAAERSTNADERDILAADAHSLVERSRATLERRVAAGRGGASPELERDLHSTQVRVARLMQPAPAQEDALKIIVENRAAEMAKGACGTGDWLTTLATHYVKTGPSGRDAEVGFFGGFLLARGAMGAAQDTPLDQWLFERRRHRDAAGLAWAVLETKFALALGRLVKEGARKQSWHALLRKCLAGVENNAVLAVNPAIHRHVATLIASTTSDDLRQAAEAFLQRYSPDAGLVGSIARPGATDAPALDPFFLVVVQPPALPKRLPRPAVVPRRPAGWAHLAAAIDQFGAVFGLDGHQAPAVGAIP
jgi:hypothetical protein